MGDDKQTEKAESLGEFLLRHRVKRGLSIDDIVAETRVPVRTLQAMEADHFEKLPAEAFARGFYSLLANYLELDAEEILERFTSERSNRSRSQYSKPPLNKGKKVNTMAARPAILAPGPFLGLTLVLLALTVAGLCWHFSWNPATYLSVKLRNLQKPVITEAQQENAALDNIGMPAETKYFLSIDFMEDTTAIVSIDNNVPENEIFTKGSTHNWYADETITLILPDSTKATLLFNGSKIDMPKPEGGFITISLP